MPNGGLPQELVVIALDEINTPNADQSRARQELLKYFNQGRQGEFFTLVALTPKGLRQIQPFTSDPKILLAALRQEQPKVGNAELTHESRDVPNPGLCELCGREIDSYRSSANANALDATVESFAQLEQAYAAFPGRKSVICFSSGLPDLEIISTLLNRSNIALYPVDLKEVHADLKEDPQRDINYRGEEQVDVTTIKGMWVPKKPDNTDMHGLATRTGGRYCTSTAALQRCIASAVEDSSSYYLLGFYIPQPERVAGWHKLDVKLSSGHEKVHARSGYYLEAKSTPSENDVRKGLLAAAQAKIGYTGVAFLVERLAAPATATAPSTIPAAATASTPAASSAASVNFRIRVPASSVMLDPGQQSLSYEIAMVPLTEKGEPASTVQTTRLNLNAQQTQQALAKGWRYDETLAQSNEVVAVKFLVRDNGAGKIGSVVVPLNK